MKRVVTALAFFSMFLAPHATQPTLAADQRGVEFRLAEAEPADGLEAANISGSTEEVYLHKAAILTNEDIAKAEVTVDEQKRFSVAVHFTKAGAEKISAATAPANIGKRLAIVVDGSVIAAPRIQSTVKSQAVVTGAFTRAEAEAIAKSMRPPSK